MNRNLNFRMLLLEFLLNFGGLFWLVLPVIILYSLTAFVGEWMAFPPFVIKCFAPFYILWANIYCAQKNKEKYPIWRVPHCIVIVFLGYILSYLVIDAYFLGKGASGMDHMTELLLYYELIYDIIVVVVGLSVYQMKVSKNNKEGT